MILLTFFKSSAPSVLLTTLMAGIAGVCLASIPVKPPSEWVIVVDSTPLYSQPSVDHKTRTSLNYQDKISRVKIVEVEGSDFLWLQCTYKRQQGFIPEPMAAPAPQTMPSDNDIHGEVLVTRWNTLPFDYKPKNMVKLGKKYGMSAERTYELIPEADQAARALIDAAHNDGITLKVISAFRTADYQRMLYMRKIKQGDWAQQVVAKPGQSEHQLGTAVDFGGREPKHFLESSFGESPEGQWLQMNAARFGFQQSFTEENQHITGYAPEPWHFRYIGIPDNPDIP